VEFERKEKKVSEEFTKTTTVVKLKGAGDTGKGEDVIYEPEKHEYPELDLEEEYLLHAEDLRGLRWTK